MPQPPFSGLRTFSLALLAVVAGACDTGPDYATVGAQAGEVAVALGARATVDGLAVAFDAVPEDSRCPTGVDCVWEGRATVRVTINDQPATLEVVDPAHRPDAGVRVGSRLVFAVALTPYPSETAPSADTPVVTLATFEAR